jgi:hypothetical protein
MTRPDLFEGHRAHRRQEPGTPHRVSDRKALVLKAWGRTSDAIAEYHEALRVRPDWPSVQRELNALLVISSAR